jgi:osmotically-inducible protein OsmY
MTASRAAEKRARVFINRSELRVDATVGCERDTTEPAHHISVQEMTMAYGMRSDDDRRRHRRDDDDDRRSGMRRQDDDERDMRRSYAGYGGARGGYERDDERNQDRDRGFGMQGEYGAERYRPFGEDRGRGGYGGSNQQRYGGSYGNQQRYGDRSQSAGRFGEGEGYGSQHGGESSYGRGSMSTGNDNQWEQRAYGSQQQQQSGPYRGHGPKGYKRSDDRIKEEVCDCLTDAAHLDASQIEVAVKDGEVTITGKVDSREDKRTAEDMAERVSGVKHVQNNLRVEQKASAMSAMGMGSDGNKSGRGGQQGQ